MKKNSWDYKINACDFGHIMASIISNYSLPLGQSPWEKALAKSSPSFWKFLVDRMCNTTALRGKNPFSFLEPKIPDTFQIRALLSAIFIPLYRSYGGVIPLLKKSDALNIITFYEQGDVNGYNPERSTLQRMKKISPAWGSYFEESVIYLGLNPYTRKVVFHTLELVVREIAGEDAGLIEEIRSEDEKVVNMSDYSRKR